MKIRCLKMMAVLMIGSTVTSCQSSSHADITPAQAVSYANAFTMGCSIDSANIAAESKGFRRQKSEALDRMQVVSYGGPTRIKLIFGQDDTLAAVLVRIRQGDDENNLKAALRDLERMLGSPSKIWGPSSDFLAGVNFDTNVYAEWPHFLLSHWDDVIWLERNWR